MVTNPNFALIGSSGCVAPRHLKAINANAGQLLAALDPHDAPGVGTPVRGGLTYREAHTLLEIIATAEPDSVDVVEVNPVLDVRNETAETAAELICSLFGASII